MRKHDAGEARDVAAPDDRLDEARTVDFAVVIGIDDYPSFRSLRGAIGDAQAFHEWLCDRDGGGVAPEHAALITSTPAPPMPVQDHIDEQLVALLERAEAIGGGRRLYLYFSGHGTSALDGASDDVALLLARWSPRLARLALSSARYQRALGETRLFDEVAMFIDCCRTAVVGAAGMPPAFTVPPGAGALARTFTAYATEPDGRAYEEPTEAGWRGHFTRQLLRILRRSPGGVDAARLKDLLERELRAAGAQRAHVVNGLRGGSRFGRGGTAPAFELHPDDGWDGAITLRDGFGELVGTHDPTAGVWRLPLAAGLYKLGYSDDGKAQSQVVDHGLDAATTIDARARLEHRCLRVWRAPAGTRWYPPPADAVTFELDGAAVRRIELPADDPRAAAPAAVLIHGADGVFVLEGGDEREPLHFHGQATHHRDPKGIGTPVRRRQLHDGDVLRCGDVYLMGGRVDPPGMGGIGARARPVADRATLALDTAAHGGVLRIFDGSGARCAEGSEWLKAPLPRGLYRVELERFDFVTSQIVDLTADVSISFPSPARPHLPDFDAPATAPPLGRGPHASRLIIRIESRARPPSEHLILMGAGQLPVGEVHGAGKNGAGDFSCPVTPGTYVLRTSASRRDFAVVIPPGCTVRVLAVDAGPLRISRVSLIHTGSERQLPVGEPAMDAVEAGLRARPAEAPRYLSEVLARTPRLGDYCTGVGMAHVFLRAGDDARLDATLRALVQFGDLPDLAILRHVAAVRRGETTGFTLLTPPLLRASLQLAMTHPAFDTRGVPAESLLARAACRAYADSIWCTWSGEPADDDGWLAATVDAAVGVPRGDLARRLAVPPASVARALERLERDGATQP